MQQQHSTQPSPSPVVSRILHSSSPGQPQAPHQFQTPYHVHHHFTPSSSMYVPPNNSTSAFTSSFYQQLLKDRPRKSVSELSFYRSHGAGSGGAGAMSTTGSLSGGGRNKKIPDPRSMTNEAFKRDCCKQIIETLAWVKYPYSLSPKQMMSASRKDFLLVLGHLLKQIDPGMIVDDKTYCEEVPKFFKELGYPISISKSSLVAPNSAHTWPTHLAAMAWLCELLKFEGECFPEILTGVFPPSYPGPAGAGGSSLLQVISKVMLENYAAFARGDSDQIDEVLDGHFNQSIKEIESSIMNKAQDIQQLKHQCDFITGELQASDQLQHENETRQQDVQKFDVGIQNIKAQVDKTEATLSETVTSKEHTEAEINQLEHRAAELQTIVDTQGITREEVQMIQQTLQQKRRTQMEINTELDRKKNENRNLECEAEERADTLSKLGRECNGILCEQRAEASTCKFPTAAKWNSLPPVNVKQIDDAAYKDPDGILGVTWKHSKASILALKAEDEEHDKMVRAASTQLSAEKQDLVSRISDCQKKSVELQKAERSLQEESRDANKGNEAKGASIKEEMNRIIATADAGETGAREQLQTRLTTVEKLKENLQRLHAFHDAEVDAFNKRLYTDMQNYFSAKESFASFLVEQKGLSSELTETLKQSSSTILREASV